MRLGILCVASRHYTDRLDRAEGRLIMSKITLIALGVSDLAKSVAFYRDKAGFELQNQMEQFAFFAAGTIMLMLNSGLRRPESPLAGAMEMIVPVESVTARYAELK